jgi:hypothetical protein
LGLRAYAKTLLTSMMTAFGHLLPGHVTLTVAIALSERRPYYRLQAGSEHSSRPQPGPGPQKGQEPAATRNSGFAVCQGNREAELAA